MFHKHSGILRAEIIAIGNEVVSGLIENSNSRFLSGRLHDAGADVFRITAVGDDPEAIAEAVRQALERVDLVITTGGLGSTHDDITKKVLAQVFEADFRTDETVRSCLEKIFRARGREIPRSVLSQCDVPDKAVILYNDKGTAPGLLFKRGGKKLFALPGIPLEMEALFEKYILPDVATAQTTAIRHRLLRTTGITEADLWTRTGPLEPLEKIVTIASLPSFLGVNIRLSALGATPEEADEKLREAETWMREKLGRFIYGTDEETLEVKVGQLLRENQKTLAVAESCTGGLIGHRLTQVPGSSDYFLEGAATYSNESKINRLGVDPALIDRHGAVSREVALAMSEGIRKTAGTDVGLSVTGIAGPTGGSAEKPVGLTFVAVSETGREPRCEKFIFHQDRVRNKVRAAQAALNLLRLWLQDH